MSAGEIGTITGGTVAAVLVPIIMKLLIKFFPAKPAASTNHNFDDLRYNYRKWEIAFRIALVPTAFLIGYIAWLILNALSNWHAAFLQDADIKLTTMPPYWALPATFISIWPAGYSLYGIFYILLGSNYGNFRRYVELKYKYNKKVEIVMIPMTAVISAALIYIGLNFYLLVCPSEIVFGRFPRLGVSHYTYGDIRSIETAPRYQVPNGKIIDQRNFVVTLADQTTISSHWLPIWLNAKDQAHLLDVLSQRSGVPIQQMDLITR